MLRSRHLCGHCEAASILTNQEESPCLQVSKQSLPGQHVSNCLNNTIDLCANSYFLIPTKDGQTLAEDDFYDKSSSKAVVDKRLRYHNNTRDALSDSC